MSRGHGCGCCGHHPGPAPATKKLNPKFPGVLEAGGSQLYLSPSTSEGSCLTRLPEQGPSAWPMWGRQGPALLPQWGQV